jgi:hypothetical protein
VLAAALSSSPRFAGKEGAITVKVNWDKERGNEVEETKFILI